MLLGFGVTWGYRTLLNEFFTVPPAQQGEVQGTKTWVQGFAGAQEKLYLGLWWEQGVGLVRVKMGNSLPVEMGVWSLWGWVVQSKAAPGTHQTCCSFNLPEALSSSALITATRSCSSC